MKRIGFGRKRERRLKPPARKRLLAEGIIRTMKVANIVSKSFVASSRKCFLP